MLVSLWRSGAVKLLSRVRSRTSITNSRWGLGCQGPCSVAVSAPGCVQVDLKPNCVYLPVHTTYGGGGVCLFSWAIVGMAVITWLDLATLSKTPVKGILLSEILHSSYVCLYHRVTHCRSSWHLHQQQRHPYARSLRLLHPLLLSSSGRSKRCRSRLQGCRQKWARNKQSPRHLHKVGSELC